jgi:hypothetical protein
LEKEIKGQPSVRDLDLVRDSKGDIQGYIRGMDRLSIDRPRLKT